MSITNKHVWFYKLCDKLHRDYLFPYPLYRITHMNNTKIKRDIHKWLRKNSLDIKICQECGGLNKCTINGDSYSEYENIDDVDVAKIHDHWHGIFIHVCYYLGINKKSAKVLWENFTQENWEHLHQTEEEKQYGEKEWFDKFFYDVLYCSDRWSLTRLERCHWAFRQWYRKAKER